MDSNMSLRSLDSDSSAVAAAKAAVSDGATASGNDVQDAHTGRGRDARETEAGPAGRGSSEQLVKQGVGTDNGCPPSRATDQPGGPCNNGDAMELTPMLGEDMFHL